MENEIYKKIIGHEKLTAIFGYWPSFHDAEILSINLERNGNDEFEGPILFVTIHVFQMGPETTVTGKFIFHHHSLITFRFCRVGDLELNGFNQQNAIDGLSISKKPNKENKSTKFIVDFEQSFGVGCSFSCDRIAITGIEKVIPKYSIYKNTKNT